MFHLPGGIFQNLSSAKVYRFHVHFFDKAFHVGMDIGAGLYIQRVFSFFFSFLLSGHILDIHC